MSTILINNTSYYYELHGEGQPLILISGYTRDNTVWLPVLDQLAKCFKVLLFDNRGAGRTKDDDSELTLEIMAHEVMLLAEELQLKNPHIVGQSMGGSIAQIIASQYTDKINKVAIIVSSAKWRTAMLKALNASLNLRKINVELDKILDTTMAWVFGETFLSDEKNIENFKRLARNNPYPQSIADQERQLKALSSFDGRHLLQKITAPTLIVNGKEDVMSLVAEGEFLAKQIKQSQFVTMDSAHGVIVEQTKALIDVLLQFLKS